jgi:hypothetical protein
MEKKFIWQKASRTALFLIILLSSVPALADEQGRINLTFENDNFASRDDRHYTNGVRFSYLTPTLKEESAWQHIFEATDEFTPLFDSDNPSIRKISWHIGQSIYTPENTQLTIPLSTDRPYAGWVYGGVSMLQDNNSKSLDVAELSVGIVGPAAGGRQTQNDFHQFILVDTAKGWDYQLENEPGLMASLGKTWRLNQPLSYGDEIEVLPTIDMTLGNVITQAQAGAMIRYGRGLKVDFGQSRIRPAMTGGDYYNENGLSDNFGYYVFAGATGRAVAQNIFLDGNTWKDSRSVDKKYYVADFSLGASIFWQSGIKIDFMAQQRTREFEGQSDPDRYGGINVSFPY